MWVLGDVGFGGCGFWGLTSSVLRGDAELHKFEIAQLGSLCPEEAEEAKTLIPRYIPFPVFPCYSAHIPFLVILLLFLSLFGLSFVVAVCLSSKPSTPCPLYSWDAHVLTITASSPKKQTKISRQF